MLTTVDLNDQTVLTTEKIREIRSDWKLPHEFVTTEALGF